MTYYLAEYQTFDSVQEMDHHIELYRDNLTAIQFRVLWLVSNYAVKYPGAAHLKASTIAEALCVSTKTVYRALNGLVTAGALVKHVQFRPIRGGQGASIYTVQPYESNRSDVAKPCERKVEASNCENESAYSSNLHNHLLDTANANRKIKSDNKISKDLTADIPATALQNAIPTPIYAAITRYFSRAEDVYRYYGLFLRAKASVNRSILFEESAETFTEAWHRAVLAHKMGRVRKAFDSYVYAALQKATLDCVRAAGKERFKGGVARWLGELA